MSTTESPAGKSLSTLAFERIHADILDGRLQPNERLRIQALSERYEVGPTAIREALSRLTTNGLVGLEDQRGFFVAPVSLEELQDLTKTRVELESLALRQAIEKGGIDWETNLLSAYHRLSRTPLPSSPQTWNDFTAVHQRFHDALIEGCGSPAMLRLCRLVLDQLERYRNLAMKHTNAQVRGDTREEHKALFDAAMARDTASAMELLAEHFGRTASIVERAVFGKTAGAASGKTVRAKTKPIAAVAAGKTVKAKTKRTVAA